VFIESEKGWIIMTEKNLKEKIRPLYSEFQGYLSQAPKAERSSDSIKDHHLWTQFNTSVNELTKVSGKNYEIFLIQPTQGRYAEFTSIANYRQKLGGIISRLHAEYFSDEPPPFSGMPSTIITQTQQQSQSVQILLDMQSKIDEALYKSNPNDEEKNFLEKFKSGLATVSSVTDLLKLCLKLAKDYGISIGTLIKFFG
jgi:hypothetical protein